MGSRVLLHTRVGVVLCALAFAVVFSVAAFGETTGKVSGVRQSGDDPSKIVVSETQIQLFKFALGLRPEQERYWGPVEAALRDLSKPQEPSPKVQRASLRLGKKTDTDARYKRLSTAAIPLIKTFDDNQRQKLELLSKTFKFEHWLSAH
jgi:hypothetical protein